MKGASLPGPTKEESQTEPSMPEPVGPVRPSLPPSSVRLATVDARCNWSFVFYTSDVSRLTDAQLHQPRLPVFHHHPQSAVLFKGRTPL